MSLFAFLMSVCLSDREALKILTPVPRSDGWSCGIEGCDDETTWIQAKPGPNAAPGPGSITVYYMRTRNDDGVRLYDMKVNAPRTFWMRESAPIEHDCNADPGPCVFDKTVDHRSCCFTTVTIHEPPSISMYGAIFPCNRRTDCHTDLATNDHLHGSAIWTAPKGWLVRVGADFWIDREKHILGYATNGEWVESTTLFSHYSW